MKIFESIQSFGKRSGKLLAPILAFVFFVLGCIYFFPLQSLETQLNSQLSRQSGQDITVIKPSLGTGLGIGLFSGGLIALKAERVEIFMPRSSTQIDCHNFTLTPNFLALLTLKIQVSIQCQLERAGPSTILASVKTPVWSFEEAELNIELEDIRLDHLAKNFKIKGWAGKLDGDVNIAGIVQGLQNASFAWNLSGAGFATPALRSDFFNLPPLTLDKINSQGSLIDSNLLIEQLEMGVNGVTPLWANFSTNMQLDRQMMPVGGTLKGKMKTDPNFEQTSLKGLNLSLLFGNVKESGMREFTKEVRGNVLSLMMNPPIE